MQSYGFQNFQQDQKVNIQQSQPVQHNKSSIIISDQNDNLIQDELQLLQLVKQLTQQQILLPELKESIEQIHIHTALQYSQLYQVQTKSLLQMIEFRIQKMQQVQFFQQEEDLDQVELQLNFIEQRLLKMFNNLSTTKSFNAKELLAENDKFDVSKDDKLSINLEASKKQMQKWEIILE
ncbi:hypothetical protein SS50377_23378 [Spironucleus salmonicida]|uniref:Uncharacterized protein n=1 Tax=Spironucleus salmonicida TaxID=348837 RepID=V6LRQ6_9EUKA|nr:hypothetical protein SS50377_23378 [Spironucleus salmonicida]|eukprot:EST47250.1 Hypothetical protein SS50377_12759 [Spironucleus salmonicida]